MSQVQAKVVVVRICIVCAISATLLAPPVRAQPEPKLLAKVGDESITTANINFQLGREPDAPRLAHAAEQTVVRLIAQQRQALQTLRRLRLGASSKEVENWIERQAQLDPTLLELDVEAFPNAEEWLRKQVAFRLSWQRYLAKHMSPRNLARHFENQRARFDGTRFKVQLLSAKTTAGKSESRKRMLEDFAKLYSQLENNEFEWESLPGKIGEKGWTMGEEGWVAGTGTLEPDAISAILTLEQPGITKPFTTTSGIHIARLYEIEQGDLKLADVQDEVRAHMLVFMLDHLAKQSEKVMPLVAM